MIYPTICIFFRAGSIPQILSRKINYVAKKYKTTIISLFLFLIYLQVISGYVFYPVALILGVDIEDCYEVGGIIGTKIILMSFFAYWDMGILLKAGKISVS